MAAAAETLRALAETVVPGPPHDVSFGAAEIEAERFIAHYLETVLPGLPDAVSSMLDGLSAVVREGAAFVDLSLEERASVIERVCTHELDDVRDLGDLLVVLSMAAVYGEWSGLDEDGELTRLPLGWELTAWPGPSDGERSLMRPKRPS